ncbi:MAG: nucleotidyltransferase family protein [Pseudomonadota bacterium]
MVRIAATSEANLDGLKVFLAGLRRALCDSDTDLSFASPQDMSSAVRIAARTKLLPVWAKGMRDCLDEKSTADLDSLERQYRLLTFERNAVLLTNLSRLHKALKEVEIEHVFYKGPLQQHQVYGDFFQRLAADIDILVSRPDFVRAAQLLQGQGFSMRHNLSLWWRVFVGQEHLVTEDAGEWSVDLHHRLQEPGVQQPRSSAEFLHAPDFVELKSVQLPVIRSELVPLICTINFVKGLTRRTDGLAAAEHKVPAAHLLDLFHILEGGRDERVRAFVATADAFGLTGSALIALRAFSAVFQRPIRGFQTQISDCMRRIDDEVLAAMVFAPGIVRDWPRPAALLWESWEKRPLRYAADYGWYLGSEIFRKSAKAGRMVADRSATSL